MPLGNLLLEIATFGLALWFGFYLIARNLAAPRLRYTGLSLVSCASGIAANIVVAYSRTSGLEIIPPHFRLSLLFLSALLWFIAVIHFLSEEAPLYTQFAWVWRYGSALATALLIISGFGIRILSPQVVYVVIVLIPSVIALLIITRRVSRAAIPRVWLGLLFVGTLILPLVLPFLIVSPLTPFSSFAVLVISCDFMMLGLVVAILDAHNEGEALFPDALHSFNATLFSAIVFGGLVALVIIGNGEVTLLTIALLLATITAAIVTQVFAEPISAKLDDLTFINFPHIRLVRTELRLAAGALPRISDLLDPATLSDVEFTQLTRRAVSHIGDLARLASSPLTRLPIVESRLTTDGARSDTLERAKALKITLIESIVRLKPHDQTEFGTSDEWRHYNALYFPYVVGLKPYNIRPSYSNLEPTARTALDWFRTQIPERTLYNWQNAAAKLVAQDLKERSR